VIESGTQTVGTEDELQGLIEETYDDPLGYVMQAFPWGEPGPLVGEEGPDANQREFLEALGEEIRDRAFDGVVPVMPIRLAESSGHGTGKSAMGGMLSSFISSTRPDSIGTVTAGTSTQLDARTWAAIRAWVGMAITAHWFNIQASGIFSIWRPDTWKILPQTCRKENAQSFAGQHSRHSSSWYLFDEASEVPDKIWETAYGGLTDGEPMIFAWGQLVRNTGEFYRVTNGSLSNRWNHRRVDSMTSKFTNKDYCRQLLEDYGEDSDMYRVRVLGFAPRASELQYIDRERVDLARKRIQFEPDATPLIAGMDVSGGGKAWNVIRFRRGLNGRVRDPIRIPGDQDKDRSRRIGICAELLNDRRPGHVLAALFVDAAFGAPIVQALRGMGYTNVYEISFGGDSPDEHFLNMRAYMYGKGKEWLLYGSIPDEDRLADQLCLAGYHLNQKSKLVIESKAEIQARGEVSPDDSDAFLLTFARAVAPAVVEDSIAAPPLPKSTWG
jgi:hypothetical protein